jgi:hypothetical protein
MEIWKCHSRGGTKENWGKYNSFLMVFMNIFETRAPSLKVYCVTITTNWSLSNLETHTHTQIRKYIHMYVRTPHILYTHAYLRTCIQKSIIIFRMYREECDRFLYNVPYVKVHRYNPKHLYPNFNSSGDNGERILKV